ncbi:DUF1697 domain-containing protein [Pontibacter sp. 172403-2]|uniref:DUF1697 domain-containing protein n=1 Tax=Pontibacter rufus TaxID=2791028 RepID=UPI0018AFA850|nr:DUF1697 domain-containing protein [Pontibacter sp. 172403-2]MBF9251987.1 DUF1697 domain-containing protein [Pontibacter sp. 172403-2]
METFISILRGINVSGQKKILMADLKALFENLGFENVSTYIQSGNVVFTAPEGSNGKELAGKIEAAIAEKYNFHVPVIIRTAAEMENILAVNPFLKDMSIDQEKLHVTFLNEIPEQEKLESIKGFHSPPDQFVIIGREVFLHCPDKYGETKLSNKFFENKLKVAATTRNWKTVARLANMAAD